MHPNGGPTTCPNRMPDPSSIAGLAIGCFPNNLVDHRSDLGHEGVGAPVVIDGRRLTPEELRALERNPTDMDFHRLQMLKELQTNEQKFRLNEKLSENVQEKGDYQSHHQCRGIAQIKPSQQQMKLPLPSLMNCSSHRPPGLPLPYMLPSPQSMEICNPIVNTLLSPLGFPSSPVGLSPIPSIPAIRGRYPNPTSGAVHDHIQKIMEYQPLTFQAMQGVNNVVVLGHQPQPTLPMEKNVWTSSCRRQGAMDGMPCQFATCEAIEPFNIVEGNQPVTQPVTPRAPPPTLESVENDQESDPFVPERLSFPSEGLPRCAPCFSPNEMAARGIHPAAFHQFVPATTFHPGPNVLPSRPMLLVPPNTRMLPSVQSFAKMTPKQQQWIQQQKIQQQAAVLQSTRESHVRQMEHLAMLERQRNKNLFSPSFNIYSNVNTLHQNGPRSPSHAVPFTSGLPSSHSNLNEYLENYSSSPEVVRALIQEEAQMRQKLAQLNAMNTVFIHPTINVPNPSHQYFPQACMPQRQYSGAYQLPFQPKSSLLEMPNTSLSSLGPATMISLPEFNIASNHQQTQHFASSEFNYYPQSHQGL